MFTSCIDMCSHSRCHVFRLPCRWYMMNVKRLFLWVVICLAGMSADAQVHKYTPADTARVTTLINSAKDSIALGTERRNAMAEEAMTISRSLNYQRGIALAFRVQGMLSHNAGDMKDAFALYKQGLDVSRRYGLKDIEGSILSGYGLLYTDVSMFDSGFISLSRALKLFEEIRDTIAIGKIYNGMAHVYLEMGNYEKSQHYLEKTLHMYRSSEQPHLVADVYINMGIIAYVQKDIDRALSYDFKAMQLYEESRDTADICVLYQNIGVNYYSLHKTDSALYWYMRALEKALEANNRNVAAAVQLDIGDLWYGRGDKQKAGAYYEKAMVIARAAGNLQVVYLSRKYISELYAENGRMSDAYRLLQEAMTVKDSLINAEKVKALNVLTSKFEVKQVQDRNTLLQNENDIQKLRLRQKDTLVYSGFGAALLVLIIGVLIIQHNRLRARQEKMELEQKQLLAQINPHFIFNCLNSIQQFVVQKDTMNANRYLADFALLMRQTLENSKDGIISLRREVDYLNNYLLFEHMRFEDKFEYNITCAPGLDMDGIQIPGMIIQPFAENAIRHGLCNLEDRKGMLHISFYEQGNFLYCDVDDNGIGRKEAERIKESSYIKYQSHGMDITRRRLAIVSKMQGGDYDITITDKVDASGEPAGTKVVIKFALC